MCGLHFTPKKLNAILFTRMLDGTISVSCTNKTKQKKKDGRSPSDLNRHPEVNVPMLYRLS